MRPFLRIVSVLCLLTLAACAPDPQPAAGAPQADVAATVSNDAFALIGAGAKAENNRPQLNLRFNRALASQQDFNQLVKVIDADGKAVDGGWVLDSDGRELGFRDVESERKYTVVIAAELLDAEGKALGSAQTRTIESVDLPPAAGFASRGSVLPARGALGLPVVAVNVPEIDVEFFRVRSAELSLATRNLVLNGRQWGYDLNQLKRYADSVYTNRFALPNGANQRQVSYLPIQTIQELKEPGLYYAVMKRAGEFDEGFEVTHYVVSDIGLHLRSYATRAEIFTRSLQTGAALSGVEIEVLDPNGVRLAKQSSDAEGRATLDFVPGADQMLLAQKGGDLTLLPMNQPALDLSEFDISGRTADQASVFIWSGRDLYRPGETLRFHALLRDQDGRPVKTGKLFGTLRQPDGRSYAQFELSAENLGYYSYQRVVGLDAPIGKWRLELATDPGEKARRHSFVFRVEEFLPERMKLALDSQKSALAPGDTLPYTVDAAYLYGAPASGNRFTAKLLITPASDLFPELKGYRYGDLANPPKLDPQDILDTTLDAEGKLESSAAIGLEKVESPLAATLLGSVFESGGRPVTRALTRVIWPADTIVGFRPLFEDAQVDYGGTASFELLRVNQAGERKAGPLEAVLIALDRDYRWSYDSDLGWRSDFTEKPRELIRKTLNYDGKQAIRFDAAVEWGAYRLEVKDPATGLLSRYPFEAGWGWQENRGLDPRPDKVKLALDKASYKAGDTMTVTVTAPSAGEGVLLVEADRLLTAQAFQAKSGSTVRLTVTEDWERHDVYITALVFKPGSAAESQTPNRSVGLLHVPMDRKSRALAVTLKAAEQIEPQSALKTEINAPALAGKEAFVTVSAVDVGVTNITSFAVPDPFAAFFSKRAFAIDARDVYGRIIESFAGEKARLRFGGDAALKALASAGRPNARVLIVDLFAQPVQLDSAGKATVTLAIPDFNGTLRVSTVVYGAAMFGSAAQEVVVRAPVVAEVGMPRVLAAGDRAQLALDLSNFTGAEQSFNAKLTGNSLIDVQPAAQAITLKDREKRTLLFTLKGGAGQGVGKISLELSGGPKPLQRSFEIAVRSAWPQTRTARLLVLDQPGTTNLAIDTSQWLQGSVRSRITLSSRIPLPTAAAAQEALDYPYGCIEQTTSRLYPYVLLDERAQGNLGLAPISGDKRSKNIQFGIDRVASMQLSSGHYAYWPGADYYDPFLTAYVVDVLMDAQDAGFALPPNLLQRSLERLKADLLAGGELSWERHNGDTAEHGRFAALAYSGYVLARVNQAPLGTLRSLLDSEVTKSKSGLPVMQLAVALKLAGDLDNAKKAAALAFGDYWQRKLQWLGDYGSSRSDQARILALALEYDLQPKAIDERLKPVADAFAGGDRSTYENMAVLRLAKALARAPSAGIDGALWIGKIEEGFKGQQRFGRDLAQRDLQQGARLDIISPGTVYLSQETVGAPTAPPAVANSAFQISRRYYRMDGSAYDGSALDEGEMLIVRLQINAQDSENPDGLVTDLLPGGLEIENVKLLDGAQLEGIMIEERSLKEWNESNAIKYEEYRDDRYVAALGRQYSAVNLFYLARAVNPGDYVVPPPLIEDMYRPALRSVGPAPFSRIEVKPRSQ